QADAVGVAPRAQHLRVVSRQQIDVPRDRLPESRIAVLPRREIAQEENSEIDPRLRRDAAQERRLILNRVADDVGEADHWTDQTWRADFLAMTIRLPGRAAVIGDAGTAVHASNIPTHVKPARGSAARKNDCERPSGCTAPMIGSTPGPIASRSKCGTSIARRPSSRSTRPQSAKKRAGSVRCSSVCAQ